ncbi:MAG TPA: hypothetical protein VNH14_10070 [Gemmatimonadales bacterium]|nr:hypothetical protein [Gemmatimonadales bacterium]
MKELFVTAQYQMSLSPTITGVAGGVIMPAAVSYHALSRRPIEKKWPHLKRRLLDPQMYLAGLNAASCREPCANLASYGWFPLTHELPFDSSAQKQTEWRKQAAAIIETTWTARVPSEANEIEDSIRSCLTTQQQLGVEALILPTPLTEDINSSFAAELEWLEHGLRLANAIAPGMPVLASIALSDVTLRGPDPWSNPLLDVVLDQLTARGVRGAYIVPIMASEDSYYFTHPNTVGALCRLCNGLKAGGVERLVVSFAGTAGLVCLAAGADAWTTGWYRSQRRMRLSDFERVRGSVVPAYYSHPLGGEFHMENDLDRAVAGGFLTRIEDETPASRGLLRALRAGKRVATVPEWKYGLGNKTASIEHFLIACSRETAKLAVLGDAALQVETGRWLQAAYALSADLQRIGPFNARTATSHQHGWLRAFERLTQERY